MKNEVINIINKYLIIYPSEKNKLNELINYVNNHSYSEMIDWNNFNGHIVASGFVYAKEDKKFLVLYHKDMKLYTYPGGHIDANDDSIVSAAKREVVEETGLKDIKLLEYTDNKNIPFDIDIHLIAYNERLNLPKHFHFDFRYIFIIDKISDVNIDKEELSDFKWIDINDLKSNPNYGNIVKKIEKITSGN